MIEYSGPVKVATLRVVDQRTQQIAEVPDWTIYGETLGHLTAEEREVLESRGVSVDDFLSEVILIPRKSSGERRYERLYLNKTKA